MTDKPKEPAELTPEREAAIVALLGLYDCGDSSCMLRYPRGPSKGMRTNGGCRCLERDREAQRTAWRLHQAAALLFEEVTRLRAERAADPVRRLVEHPRFYQLCRRQADEWFAIASGLDTLWSTSAEEACAAALAALGATNDTSGDGRERE